MLVVFDVVSSTHVFVIILLILNNTFTFFFFFNDTATTEIYTLSLHDALPIFGRENGRGDRVARSEGQHDGRVDRSEEHTSELQSRRDLVCRLLLEKKKKNIDVHMIRMTS